MNHYTQTELSPLEIQTLIEQSVQKVIDRFITILDERKEPEIEFLCRKQAARLLGVSLPTLSKLVKEQQIKPLYLGSLIRFDKNQLEKCLKSRTTKKGGI